MGSAVVALLNWIEKSIDFFCDDLKQFSLDKAFLNSYLQIETQFRVNVELGDGVIFQFESLLLIVKLI